jgi:hypothetical protein
LLIASALPLHATEDCARIDTQAGPVGYCISTADRHENPDVIYYFHGADGPAIVRPELNPPWRDGAPHVREIWRRNATPPPTIITISWGATWILKDEKLAAFRDELIPRLEARLGPIPVGRRMIVGGSMGGLNALIAWVSMPEMLSAVALQCPALTGYSPLAGWWEHLREEVRLMWHYGKMTPSGRRRARETLDLLALIFKPHLKSADEWGRYQPPALMKQAAGRKLPPAYLVYNTDDEYGFNGAPEIAAAGHAITYERLPGGHCIGIATPGLAAFLANPERSGPSAAPVSAKAGP